MKKQRQDDIARLCSLVSLDRSEYRVFNPVANLREKSGEAQIASPEQASTPVERNTLSGSPDEKTHGTTKNSGETAEIAEQTSCENEQMAVSRASVLSLEKQVGHTTQKARRALQNIRVSDGAEVANPHHARKPTLCIVGAAGGVGVTTAAATLTKLLARQDEQILLAEDKHDSVLPIYFGGRIGSTTTRSYFPAHKGSEAPVHILGSTDSKQKSGENERDGWQAQIESVDFEFNRLVLDCGNEPTPSILKMLEQSICVVLARPDVTSVLGVQGWVRILDGLRDQLPPLLILNNFDKESPFHQEMRAWFEDQFSAKFHILTITYSDEASEALAEGATVVDFAPESALAKDWSRVASYINALTTRFGTASEHERIQALRA